ncbi:hypothetical protein WDW37_00055 [Bdellovibrionota bacterium FG-1]
MTKLQSHQVTEFGAYFKNHLKDYSIIGGAATLIHLDERAAGTHTKATKDLDIAVLDLSADGKTSTFLTRFTRYVDEMQYDVFTGKTEKAHAYRFMNPKAGIAPHKIEIATRLMEGLKLKGEAQRLTEFDISAIVCDPVYIEHLKSHSEAKVLSGTGGAPVNVARASSIILMKALAYVNLIANDAMKHHAARHAADIMRLSAVLNESDRIEVQADLYAAFERLVSMSSTAFPVDRVKEIRGKKVPPDQVISELK